MKVLLDKFKEVFLSVLPITVFVLFIHFAIVPLDQKDIIRFVIGSIFIIIGMTIFLIGVDTSVTPLGTMMGSFLTKTNSVTIVGVVGFFLGFIISIAEPALHILAGQVSDVTSGAINNWSLIIAVSIGLALMISVGLLRKIFNVKLNVLLTILYAIIFVLAIFTPKEFLVIAFDSSGATTGAMAVPFLLSLSLGISSMKRKGSAGNDDSFGLVAIASAGAILGVLVMGIFANTSNFTGDIQDDLFQHDSIMGPFRDILGQQVIDVLISLAPILAIFIVFQIFSFKLKKRDVRKVIQGMIYTAFGLILFLLGVNGGFMKAGKEIGFNLVGLDKDWLLVIIGFVLGFAIILAEPAVYVLNRQIEDVTSGSVKRISVIISLGLGVGTAVALSVLRVIIPSLELWHYLIPGYLIAFTLAYIVPNIFVGMAFDSGGVASGPMIGTFIFAVIQGVADGKGANLLTDGFGMISMVALTPLIALQLLGLAYKVKSRRKV